MQLIHDISESVTARFTDVLTRYPWLGFVASGGAVGSGILTMLNYIPIIFGAGGAIFGCLAAFYTWRIKRREWLKGKQDAP